MNNQPSSDTVRPSLLSFGRSYTRLILLTTLLTATAGTLALALPYLTGKVIDAATTPGGLPHLKGIVYTFIGLCVVLAMFQFAQSYMFGFVSARVGRDLLAKLLGHLIGMDLHFYESKAPGELLSRMNSDVNRVRFFLANTFPNGIRAVIMFITVLVIVLIIDYRLTIAAVLAMLPGVLMTVVGGPWHRKINMKEQDVLAANSGFAEEILNGIKTIRAAGREKLEGKRYFAKLENLLRVQLRNAQLVGGLGAILWFVQHLSSIVVLWYGGTLVFGNKITPGELVSFMLYMNLFTTSAAGVGTFYADYQTIQGASARLFEILGIQPLIKDPATPVPLSKVKGSITFANVRFSYPSAQDRRALEAINFSVQPGEVIGLVGPSGAGKTTVFSLFLRFYDPCSGAVLIDDKDIRSVKIDELRRNIGLVPQEIFLFDGTIGENISYYQPDATAEQIRDAAIAAGADEFIAKLPKAYQEMVGQRGVRLSAGQRQRIAIARAFLMNPPILLLDEATSSLDSDSEEKVTRALSGLMEGRTTFVIAHRLTTALRADRIFVMDQGQIVAIGNHKELYKSNDLYKRYWTLQSMPVQNIETGLTQSAI